MGIISNRITECSENITIQEFSERVGEQGCTFTRALFKEGRKMRKKENFLCQELFVLDVDKGLPYKDFIERAKEYEIYPFLVYKTFSASYDLEKYRAVYLCDYIIEDETAADFMNEILNRIYPEADTQCKELARMFLGGKGIIYFNQSSRVNIQEVVRAYEAYTKSRAGKNYRRTIVAFAAKLGVRCENGCLAVYDKQQTVHTPQEPYVTIGNTVIELCEKVRPNTVENKKSYKKDTLGGTVKIPILQVDRQKLEKYCPLLKEFKDKEVSHGEKFMLATNLVHIKGGKSIFFNGVIDNRQKWEVDWRRIKEYEYFPQDCENGKCRYREKCGCKSLYAKLSTKIRKLRGGDSYIEIEKGEAMLKEYFQEAVLAADKSIHLIKAQTAIGKTKAYCDMAAEYMEVKFMFVLPTIKLQEEVCGRLESYGIQCYKTRSSVAVARELRLDVYEEIRELYEIGGGQFVKAYLRKYIEENKGRLTETEVSLLEESLDMKNKLDGSCCVVTTHKLFLHLPQNVLNKYEIIIDEDILMAVIKENDFVSIGMVEMALNSTTDIKSEDLEKLKWILSLPDKKVERNEESTYSLSNKNTDYLRKYGKVYGLLGSAVYCVDKEKDIIHYFHPHPLPDVKMIVLSATLNKKLYKDYCRGRNVKFYEVPEVRYKGQLIQFTKYSMSRKCIEEKGKELIIKVIKEMTGISEDGIFSFKTFGENKEIYFGKAEGFNEYTGKNLVVLGTPHCAESVYLLLGKYLGYDTDDTLATHRIERGQYSFPIMTYENQHMQNLQLFFLESELEQIVGRARLLRNNCIVYLFSNFPLRQSEICQDDYLQKQ